MEKFSIEMPKEEFGEDSEEFKMAMENWEKYYPELQFKNHGGAYGIIEIIGTKENLENWIAQEGFDGWEFKFESLNESCEKVEEVKENLDDVYPKFEFTQEDADYIQNLVGDSLDIKFLDDTFQGIKYGGKIEIALKPTKYIESGIVNLSDEFYKDVEAYIQKQYPNAELDMNNTGSIIYIRPKKDGKPSRPTYRMESKEVKTEALSQDLPDWLRAKLNRNKLTKYKSRYSNDRVPVMNIAWDKVKYVPAEIPQTARATDLKDTNKLPVFKLKVPGYLGDTDAKTEIYVPGLLDPEIHGELVNSRSYYLPVSKASYKQLLPYIEEFGYIVLDDETKTGNLRLSREKGREGSVERDMTKGLHSVRDYLGNGKYSDELRWVTDRGYDKSGYPLDPDRQLKKLAKMSLENDETAAKRIETIYNQIEDVKTRVANVLTNRNIKDLTGNSEIEKWDTKMYRIERAVRYLGDAVKQYTDILQTIDRAKNTDGGLLDSWLAHEFKSKVVEIKSDLKECNDCLTEFETIKTESKKLQENETDGYRAVAIMDASESNVFYTTIMLNKKHSVKDFQKAMNEAYERNKEEIVEFGNDLNVVLENIDPSFDWYEIETDEDYLTI